MDQEPVSLNPEEVSAPKRRLSKAAKEFTPKMAPAKPQNKKPFINAKQLEKLYMQNLGFISAVMTEENKHVFKNQFLRLEDYSNLESVRRCFDPLEFVNEPSLKTEELQQSRAVIIRSKTYDDIHKAMKYGVWTSNREKNVRLNELYKECLAKKQRLLLFFRVVKDNLFCGVAEVISHYIEEQKFNLWWENQKWQGIFNIRWIFVKNLPLLRYNLVQNQQPVHELRDGDPLSGSNKDFLLAQFKTLRYSFKDSVFKFFQKFDEREDQLISNRTVLDFQFKLQKTERKERGRRRKCSLIEGRPVQEEEPPKEKEGDGKTNQSADTAEGEAKMPRKKRKRHRKKKGQREGAGKAKRRERYYDDYYDEREYEDYDDYKTTRSRRRKEEYDDYYYDDYHYEDEDYGYYHRKKKTRDDHYESDYYVRKDEKNDSKNKSKKKQNKRKNSEKNSNKAENKSAKQGKNNRRRFKVTKKKYVIVKETQVETIVESN